MEIGKILDHLKEEINASELILIGVGEGLNTGSGSSFQERCHLVKQKKDGFIKNGALQSLALLLSGKNYFIVSTNVDECLYYSGFHEGRLVTPCGREGFFQCSQNCSNKVWEPDDWCLIQENPICPDCGKPAVFNEYNSKDHSHYCEQGYLSDWGRYMKWLSGTLNKKLLLLELGCGFTHPELIRWAFERTAFINTNAHLIRIHKTLANIPVQLKEKAEGYLVDPVELLCTVP